ncbi:MAG: hypothetical protein JNM29_13045 [Candidatus Odyssella sp.]|nr:hypothetical protein [Candidatus Odyssella sp.]
MRLACIALAALVALVAPASAQDARDRTFAPGRVGAIVKGKTRPLDLARIFGARNVQRATMDEPGGGEPHPGAYIFKGTPSALTVHFTEDGKSIRYVAVLGPAWRSKEGLRVGTTAAELERLNGGPFKFYGFGFDYGGQVFADGAALAPYSIFVRTGGDDAAAIKALTQPEVEISSQHPAVPRAGLEVSFIQVSLGP